MGGGGKRGGGGGGGGAGGDERFYWSDIFAPFFQELLRYNIKEYFL